MSRGYKKTAFSARETTRDDTLTPIGKTVSDAAYDKALNIMLGDKKVMSDYKKFMSALLGQQREASSKHNKKWRDEMDESHRKKNNIKSGDEFSDQLKANKIRMIKAFDRLPQAVKDVIEVPRSEIYSLQRGVYDRGIREAGEWKNGNFAYGFSSNAATAQHWASYASDDGRQPLIIGASDIESFKGIIDVDKAWKLLERYNGRVDESVTRKPVMISFKGEDNSKHYYRSNPYSGENESIVYGIKFKKSGDDFYQDR